MCEDSSFFAAIEESVNSCVLALGPLVDAAWEATELESGVFASDIPVEPDELLSVVVLTGAMYCVWSCDGCCATAKA